MKNISYGIILKGVKIIFNQTLHIRKLGGNFIEYNSFVHQDVVRSNLSLRRRLWVGNYRCNTHHKTFTSAAKLQTTKKFGKTTENKS